MAINENLLKAERDEAWRHELRNQLKNKERSQLPRVHMTEEEPQVRVKSYVEVNRGLTIEEAVAESRRCLDCPALPVPLRQR